MIDSIINGANDIEQCLMMTVLSLPMIQMTGNEQFLITERREFDLPYYRRTRLSTTTVSDEWIDEYVDLWANFVEMNGIYGNTVFTFYPSESVSTFSRNTTTVSFPWRDLRIWVASDIFYDPEIADFDEVKNQMDSAWNRWLVDDDDVDRNQSDSVLFGDGVDRRWWAFTDGDVNISNVWRYYIESEDKYNELRRIKTAVDGIDLFSNQFTIPPLELDENTESEPHSWSLTAREIVAISTIGFSVMTLLVIGIGTKWNFRSGRARDSENELTKRMDAPKATMEDGRGSQSEGAEVRSQSAVVQDGRAVSVDMK